jgi:hypothetical protein
MSPLHVAIRRADRDDFEQQILVESDQSPAGELSAQTELLADRFSVTDWRRLYLL